MAFSREEIRKMYDQALKDNPGMMLRVDDEVWSIWFDGFIKGALWANKDAHESIMNLFQTQTQKKG